MIINFKNLDKKYLDIDDVKMISDGRRTAMRVYYAKSCGHVVIFKLTKATKYPWEVVINNVSTYYETEEAAIVYVANTVKEFTVIFP